MAGTLRGGSRENVGEGMGMGAIRSGHWESDFLDNNDLPTNSSVPNNRFPTEKPGDTDKNNPHIVSGTP